MKFQHEDTGRIVELSESFHLIEGELLNHLRELEEKLKWAYAQSKNTDTIIGLDMCDDFHDWFKTLKSPY